MAVKVANTITLRWEKVRPIWLATPKPTPDKLMRFSNTTKRDEFFKEEEALGKRVGVE